MKKIISNVIPLLLLCALFFLIGFGLSESLHSKDVVKTAEYSDDKLINVQQSPLFTFKDPIKDKIKTSIESLGECEEVVESASTEPVEPVTSETETLIGSDFKLYHYAPTGHPTASGRMPVVGTTVAVDPKYIKLGTWLRIEIPDGNGGYKVYRQKARADDTGGNIKGHVLDVFVGSESEAEQCGVIRNARVYIVKE